MIEVKSLCYSYDASGPNVLNNINFCVEPGHCTAIMGNNGAGKSTLLKCLNRIHQAKKGSVLIDNRDLFRMSRNEMARNIAYVPQRSDPSHTMVFDAVLLGRKPYIQWDASEKDKKIVRDILDRFQLSSYSARFINELSGGELQRVILARAMAQKPKYLLLDEPTSNLDPTNQHEMLKTVREIAIDENIGIAIVIHDLNLAVRYCDRFVFLKDSRVYAKGDLDMVSPEVIYQVYGLRTDMIDHKGIKVLIPVE